jgi:hypothetical protein
MYHMGPFTEQLQREVQPLFDLRPAFEDDARQLVIQMWDVIEDPILVMPLRRRLRQIAARELRYMAENHEGIPGPKQSRHVREAYRLRRQADRFGARP